MMSVRDVLQLAVTGAPQLLSLANEVASLLESGTSSPKYDEFILKLGRALEGKRGKVAQAELGAARACLKVLHDLQRLGAARSGLVELASGDEAAEALARKDYEVMWQCAVCGSARINEDHSDRGTKRYIQLMCTACGNAADGMADAPNLKRWVY